MNLEELLKMTRTREVWQMIVCQLHIADAA